MTRFILDRDNACAVAFVEAHKHGDYPELYFTTILGTWGDEKATNDNDHTTIACRYGFIEDEEDYVCSLMDVPITFISPLGGELLNRVQALKHDRVIEFWHVVDYLLENDLAIHDFLNHPLKNTLKTTLRRY